MRAFVRFFTVFGRRHSTLVMSVLISALFFTTTVFAQRTSIKETINSPNSQPITITAPTMTTTAPNTFTVDISASDMTGDGVTSFQFDIFFDPDIIVPSGSNSGCSTAGTITPPSYLALCNVTPSNRIRVSVQDFFLNPMSGAGTILKITFQTVPGVFSGDISPLTFVPGSVRVFAAGIGELTSQSVDGEVRISINTAAATTVGGKVTNRAGQPISKVRVLLTDTDGVTWVALTNSFGFFQFNEVKTGVNYVLSAEAKRYRFPSRVLAVDELISGLDIVAEQ